MKFGLIGHPIKHSLSPALFKAGYDGLYPYELIETPDFEEAYRIFLEGYDGINVTAPFKELAIKKADILSEECQKIGATNLLIKTAGGVMAHNSDYLGVRIWIEEISRLASLARNDRETTRNDRETVQNDQETVQNDQEAVQNDQEAVQNDREATRNDRETVQNDKEAVQNDREGCDKEDKTTVLIVGMGGAGKAAAEAGRSLGCEVILMNRTQYSNEIRPLSEFKKAFRVADIVIYNLPVRLPELDLIGKEDFIEGKPKNILEANYLNPSFDDDLIHKFEQMHPQIQYTGGKTWLLLQALTGYEIFTGQKPDLEKMAARL